MIYFILLPLAFFLLTLWRRDVGVAALLLVLPTYLLRTSVLGIPTTLLEVSLYSVAVAVLAHAILHKDKRQVRLPRWCVALLLGWILSWGIATIFSTDRQASLGACKAWLIDPLLFGYLLLLTVRSTRQRSLLIQGMAASGTLVALGGIAQVIFLRNTLQDGRLSSFFAPVANYAAMFLAPVLVLTVGAVLWKQLRARWWWSVAVISVAVILTVSFGGYLAVVGGMLLLWLTWPNRRQRGIALFVAGAILLFGSVVLLKTPYVAEKITAGDRSSSLVRSQIWRTSIEIVRQYPIVGIGPNAYEHIYRETIPHLYFPPLEWLVAQPHQLYLALWLETGILGLSTFIVFLVFWFRSLRLLTSNRNTMAIFSAAAMIAILLHGLIDTPVLKNDLMIVFMLIVLLPLLNIDQ